jgi:hypothetical protein
MTPLDGTVLLYTTLTQPEFLINVEDPEAPVPITWSWSGGEWTMLEVANEPVLAALMATP